MKEVFAPHLGHNVKFGRLRPEPGMRRLHLRHYITPIKVDVPDECDYSAKALEGLHHSFLNDQLGDCVIAGAYHIIGVASANAGTPFVATDDQIVNDYKAIGGYDPNNPDSDGGCNEVDAMNYWTKNSFADGSKLSGWVTLNASNKGEIMTALYLFENLYLGIELPDAWCNPMPEKDGFIWDVAGDPYSENGHCIMSMSYNQQGAKIDSWGLLGTLTWAAIDKYCSSRSGGEIYSLVSPDVIGKGQTKAPNGISWEDLMADFTFLK